MPYSSVIDSHLHIGKDNFWSKKGDLDEYIEHAKKIGISTAMVMSVPCPVLSIEGYKISSIFAGYYGEDHIDEWIYCQEIVNPNNQYSYIPPQQNPYQLANIITYQKLADLENSEIDFHFVPIVHPYFDTLEYLEYVIDFYSPKAIKLHGLSAIIKPQDISDKFWNLIRQSQIPLIIHTDVYHGKIANNLTDVYRNYNTPLEWLKVLQKNQIRAYLTHGIRLCPTSAKIVNECNDFVVGIGPDYRLSSYTDQLYSNKPYLNTLFDMVSIDKLCFDTDYPWNTLRDEGDSFDWNSVERIKALGFSQGELNKILHGNASNFFAL